MRALHKACMDLCKQLVSFILIICVSVAYAGGDKPETLAESYFQKLIEEGITSTGQFMHPDALADFRNMLMPVYEAEANSGQRGLMDLTFGSEFEIDDLRKISAIEFYDGFLILVQTQMGETQINYSKIEVLGSVAEGEDQHVLTRVTMDADELGVTGLEVLSFSPYKDTWKLQLTGEIRGMAVALNQSLNQQ